MTTWFITGASRGFGLEIARQALERGDNVVATARTPAPWRTRSRPTPTGCWPYRST